MPSVNLLYTSLRDRGFEVLLVSFREDPNLVSRTAHSRGYVARVLLDQSGEVAGRHYGVWGTPTAYFVDRRGRLLGRIFGPRPWDSSEARRLVEALLAME